MNIRIEIVDDPSGEEIVIRCGKIDSRIENIQKYISEQSAEAPKIVFFKDGSEYYFSLNEVLFFETEGDRVYAHTAQDSYRIRHRLYELEDILPRQFVRVSKSTIINASRIHSINRNLTSASMVEFRGSHKHVYVSRRYYGALRRRLDERSQ